MWPFSPSFEIRSRSGELHFQRWKIIETPWFGFYIHRILKSDEDLHPHSHPWDYISILIKGKYSEWDEKGNKKKLGWLSFSRKGRKKFHKLELEKPAWSLFFRGPKKWSDKASKISSWGYLVDGANVHHKDYRERKRLGDFHCPPDLYIIEGFED